MKIFVVTVCRNALADLRVTIGSIVDLNDSRVHYLVVDGASSDGTQLFLRENPAGVSQWISEPDGGIYDAMNKAVSLLPSDDGHVLFLGAGDRLLTLPAYSHFKSTEVLYADVMVGDRCFISSAGWTLRAGNTLHHQALFVPRAIAERFPFDTNYKIYADFDVNQRLLRSGIRFRRLNQIVAYAAPGGVSWKSNEMEMVVIARKNFGLLWGWLARVWSYYRVVRANLFGVRW